MNDQVNIPNASNVSSRLVDSSGWSFFDLNTIHDEYKDDSTTTVEIDFVSITRSLLLLLVSCYSALFT